MPATLPRRRSFLASWAASWVIPAALVAIALFAIWPLLAFRHHWTTTVQVPCSDDGWVLSGGTQCSPLSDAGTWTKVVAHSSVSPLGAGLTLGWIGFWFVLVMTGSVLGRRQKARRGLAG